MEKDWKEEVMIYLKEQYRHSLLVHVKTKKNLNKEYRY